MDISKLDLKRFKNPEAIQLPEGDYLAILENIVPIDSPKNDNLKLRWRILGGPYHGNTCFTFFKLSNEFLLKLFCIMVTNMGFDLEYINDTKELIGHVCKLRMALGHDEQGSAAIPGQHPIRCFLP